MSSSTVALTHYVDLNTALPRGIDPKTTISLIPMEDVTEDGRWIGFRSTKAVNIGGGLTPFQDGDTLVAKITPCFENGKGAFLCGLVNGKGIGSTEFHVLRPKSGVAPRLVHHFARLPYLRQFGLAFMSGSAGQQRVSADCFHRFLVPGFEADEQRRIAAILDASEATIRATEAVIAKLRLERVGLVLRLMDWATATELLTLGALLDRDGGTIQTGPFGSQLHSWEYQREGTPVVMPQDIDLEWDCISSEKVAKISQRRANDLSRHAMVPGDIVFARRGDLIRAATIADAHKGWLCGTGCFLLRTDGEAINPKWLVLAYRSPTVQRQVSIEATGTTMPNLNGTIMRGLRLRVPNRERQDHVVQVVESSTTGINTEQSKLAKLRLKHQGLLHDLLTGTVHTHA